MDAPDVVPGVVGAEEGAMSPALEMDSLFEDANVRSVIGEE